MVLAVRFNGEPEQTGLLEEAVGAEGTLFTVTTVVPAKLEQPETVAVTLYVPEAAVVGEAMAGFCEADANPLGPVHV